MAILEESCMASADMQWPNRGPWASSFLLVCFVCCFFFQKINLFDQKTVIIA